MLTAPPPTTPPSGPSEVQSQPYQQATPYQSNASTQPSTQPTPTTAGDQGGGDASQHQTLSQPTDRTAVTEVEYVANLVYSTTKADQIRGSAAASEFQRDPARITPLVHTLMISTDQFAVLFAAQSLERLLNLSWGVCPADFLQQVYNTLFQVLRVRQSELQPFHLTAISVTFSAAAKNFLADSKLASPVDLLRTLRPQDATRFPTPFELKVLELFFDELGKPNPHRTGTYWRSALKHFRDHPTGGVLSVFRDVMETLKAVLGKPQDAGGDVAAVPTSDGYVQTLSKVTLMALSYNFSLVSVEDADAEGAAPIPFPGDWRPLLLDEQTPELFWELYEKPYLAGDEQSGQSFRTTCLECLIQIVSTRPSLYLNEPTRLQRLRGYIAHTTKLMNSFEGLSGGDGSQLTLKEFCRLLNRMKNTTTLKELITTLPAEYQHFIQGLRSFTLASFESWKHTYSGALSLTCLWTRLAKNAVLLEREKDGALTAQSGLFTSGVLSELLLGFLTSRTDLAAENFEVALQDVESMDLQFHFVSGWIRSQYDILCPALLNQVMEPLITAYEGVISCDPASASLEAISDAERRLWVSVSLALHCVRNNLTPARLITEVDALNADILLKVLTRLIPVVNRRVDVFGVKSLPFHGRFGEVIGDNMTSLEALECSIAAVLYGVHKYCLLNAADPLGTDSDLLSSMRGKAEGLSEDSSDEDIQTWVVGCIVAKMFHSWTAWGTSAPVLEVYLSLLRGMKDSSRTSKILVNLPSIQSLMSPQVTHHFPFQSNVAMKHSSLIFRSFITKLLLVSSIHQSGDVTRWKGGGGGTDQSAPPKCIEDLLTDFVAPLLSMMKELEAVVPTMGQFLSLPQHRTQLILLLTDVRGVFSALTRFREFVHLFHTVIRPFIPVFQAIAVHATPAAIGAEAAVQVETALLRFLVQATTNYSDRMHFPRHSPFGVVLFKGCASVVSSILERRWAALEESLKQLQVPATPESAIEGLRFISDRHEPQNHRWWSKPCYLALQLAINITHCTWCNLGAVKYYGDVELSNCVRNCARWIAVYPSEDLVSIPKLRSSIYHLLQASFYYIASLYMVESVVHPVCLTHLLRRIHQELLTADTNPDGGEVAVVCSTALQRWTSFCHDATHKSSALPEDRAAVQQWLSRSDTEPLFYDLLDTVFTNVVNSNRDTAGNGGLNELAFARPLLPLMIFYESGYQRLVQAKLQRAARVLPPEKLSEIQTAFGTLTNGLSRELDDENNEVFLKRLIHFRYVVSDALI